MIEHVEKERSRTEQMKLRKSNMHNVIKTDKFKLTAYSLKQLFSFPGTLVKRKNNFNKLEFHGSPTFTNLLLPVSLLSRNKLKR